MRVLFLDRVSSGEGRQSEQGAVSNEISVAVCEHDDDERDREQDGRYDREDARGSHTSLYTQRE